MKKFLTMLLIVMFAFVVTGVRATGETNKISKGIDLGSSRPLNVIVELTAPPVSVYKKTFRYRILSVFNKNISLPYERKIISSQKKVVEDVKKYGISPKFHYSYAFNGFSCTISPEGVKALSKLRVVKRIYPDKKAYLLRKEADKVIGATEVHKIKGPGGQYLTGKGIVVGVVDTGVDYNDTELGGGGFPNSKVIGGYDFANNDPDPMDTDGHGTHVAGIIAGSKYGVAPDAKIMAYKVFGGNSDSTSTSLIVEGIDRAVKDKCNVINISIGTVNGEGNGSDAESVAVKNAVESGVVVVAAGGNWGSRSQDEPFPFSSPASSKYAIGVGASDDSQHGIIEANGKSIFSYYPSDSPYFRDGQYTLVYCGYGTKQDFKGKNVKGKIALIKRGNIYFGDKDLNAKAAGAVGVICFNNVAGLPAIKLVSQINPKEKDFIPFLFVSNTDGTLLLKTAKNGEKVSIANKGGLGLIATFSSEGPTSDFTFKPDLVAPGVNINSTVLHNKYESWSGTSMASPFVAGCAALLLQERPNLSPKYVKSLLMNTATILTNPDSGKPFSPFLQGAGRVNILNAVNSNVVITPPAVLFGSGEKSKTQTFTVKNFSSNVLVLSLLEKVFSNESINVSSPNSIVVPAGGISSFTVKFAATDSVSSNVFGAIFVSGSGAPIHIPFAYIPDFHIPRPIEGVSLSKEALDGDDTAYLRFDIRVGSESKDQDKTFTQNIADEVRVRIFNSYGKPVETLFDKSPLFIGQYEVPIATKDGNGNYVLKNGTYFYKISYVEPNEDPESKQYFPEETKCMKSGSFTVKNVPTSGIAVAPESGETLLLHRGEEFAVYVSLWLKNPIMNLKGSLSYDPSLLNFKGMQTTDSKEVLKYNVLNGKIFFTVSGNITDKGKILKVVFDPVDSGSGYLKIDTISIYPLSENFVVSPLFYKIGDYVRPWDINEDKVVDYKDFEIFRKSFLLGENNENFNPKCDFNKDGVVDSNDFFELGKHFGEIYP